MVLDKKYKKIIKKTATAIGVLCFWLLIWQMVHLLLSNDLKMFLPDPVTVFKKWLEICFKPEFLYETGLTLLRIFGGYIAGIVAGIVLGVITAEISLADALISPVLRIIRAVPVVSFIILAFLFFKIDILPAFISFLMVSVLVWQGTHNGIQNFDIKLDEMCNVYSVGRIKKLVKVKIPLCLSEIISAALSALGLAWKSGVAAEVICTPKISLGHRIYSAKTNLEYDEIYAVTLTVVLLSILIEFALKYIYKLYSEKRKEENRE